MDEGQKPFACRVEGCEMTFTNEDHLNCHQKKHDMVLNLGLANKSSELADQTPTPTRFIRNCEEVGLFQDLQNVNPFDETFKKAIETVRDGNLSVLSANPTNDDTLHTPHIFPHIETHSIQQSNRNSQSDTSALSDFCINNVTISSGEDDDDTNDSFPLKIVTDTVNSNPTNFDKGINLKEKLKQAIQNKNNKSLTDITVITPVTYKKPQNNENSATGNNKRNISSDSDEINANNKKQKPIDDEKEKLREMNRAAQLRCRKRKQVQLRSMEEELKVLKNANYKLIHENNFYKQSIYAVKELLTKHKNDSALNNSELIKKIEEIVNTPITNGNKVISKKIVPISQQNQIHNAAILSPILPIAQKPVQLVQSKPLFIQVMGPVSGLAVSVLPNK